MTNNSTPFVCPAEFSGSLDNKFRKLFHDPRRILSSLVNEGMNVIDLGCGPGYFTIAISELVGDSGKVIAVDLQQGMLEKLRKKMTNNSLVKRIVLHKCEANKLGLTKKVDFVFAFWMIHEVPDQDRLFAEIKALLNPGGKIFIVEPKWHVTLKEFNKMIDIAEKKGFKVISTQKVSISRAVVLA